MPFFRRDELTFHYVDTTAGEGVEGTTPFVFQHGLGGDVEQPSGVLRPPPGVRLLSFDCRGHGKTRPVGAPERFTITAFADDLAAFLDEVEIEDAIVGGISMGAAVALNFALRYPDRLRGLVLSRPAWLDSPTMANAVSSKPSSFSSSSVR